jgi:hypothetical protein
VLHLLQVLIGQKTCITSLTITLGSLQQWGQTSSQTADFTMQYAKLRMAISGLCCILSFVVKQGVHEESYGGALANAVASEPRCSSRHSPGLPFATLLHSCHQLVEFVVLREQALDQ